jgi:hypothetical protein
MRHFFFVFLIGALLPVIATAAENDPQADDRAAIRRAALDYIEGWYTKDPERMERALHYQMIKRLVGVNTESNQSYLDEGSALRLVQATRPIPGRQVPQLENQQRDVYILDVFGNAASVKIEATQWVDYLHMVKWNGEWKILNVLWELKPEQ